MRRGIIGSCQSAAISKIVKALLVTSLPHVSSTITSARPLLLSLPLPLGWTLFSDLIAFVGIFVANCWATGKASSLYEVLFRSIN